MEKRTIIIMLIISTLISLSVIILSYFGIIRYIMIKFQSPESFITNYHKLPKNKEKIILAVSTTPERINKIQPMIISILDQTIKVDQISLILPQKYIEENNTIPNYLTKIVNILPSGKKYGSECCNSLIPMLLHEKECDTIIIALKDNVIYGKDFIEKMLSESENNPDMVLKDQKNKSLLVKPEHYDCNILDRTNNYFNDDWFMNKAKNKVINYTENYNIF